MAGVEIHLHKDIILYRIMPTSLPRFLTTLPCKNSLSAAAISVLLDRGGLHRPHLRAAAFRARRGTTVTLLTGT